MPVPCTDCEGGEQGSHKARVRTESARKRGEVVGKGGDEGADEKEGVGGGGGGGRQES